jgi:hypothetical protein
LGVSSLDMAPWMVLYYDENSSKQSGALMFVRLKGLSCEGSYTRALGLVLLGVITKVAFSKGMI